jgi:hypothetical protein
MFNLHVDRGTEVGTGVDGVVTELLLDTEDLVELGKTLRSGGSTSLDLAGAETDNNVSNGDILSLARAVRNHDTPVGGKSVLGGLDGLGDGTNLVDLEEEGVASLGLDSLLDEGRVGDGQVITGGFVSILFLSCISALGRAHTQRSGHRSSWQSSSMPPNRPRRRGPRSRQ